MIEPEMRVDKQKKIRRGRIVAFGQQDSKVSPAQSKRLINVLKKRGHQPVVFSRHWEGHGFADSKIQCDYYLEIEAFLRQNL